MADVELTYKGATIGTLSASGTLTMETAGKYCEDDITLTYTSPGGGGGTEELEKFINNQLTSFENSNLTSLPASSFRQKTALQIVKLPSVTSIKNYDVFNGCTGLEELYLDSYSNSTNANEAGNALVGCTSLRKLYAPLLQYIPSWVSNTSLTALEDITLSPTVLGIRGNAFRGSKITVASFPFITFMNNSVFQDCPLLTTVDILNSNHKIENAAFKNAASMTVLVIRRTGTICPLDSTAAFDGTPFASSGAGGTLYVPSALKSTYQGATNWSTLLGYANNSIETIEGSYYETHYADGTVIS